MLIKGKYHSLLDDGEKPIGCVRTALLCAHPRERKPGGLEAGSMRKPERERTSTPKCLHGSWDRGCEWDAAIPSSAS